MLAKAFKSKEPPENLSYEPSYDSAVPYLQLLPKAVGRLRRTSYQLRGAIPEPGSELVVVGLGVGARVRPAALGAVRAAMLRVVAAVAQRGSVGQNAVQASLDADPSGDLPHEDTLKGRDELTRCAHVERSSAGW